MVRTFGDVVIQDIFEAWMGYTSESNLGEARCERSLELVTPEGRGKETFKKTNCCHACSVGFHFFSPRQEKMLASIPKGTKLISCINMNLENK